jgi:hypothetical protein
VGHPVPSHGDVPGNGPGPPGVLRPEMGDTEGTRRKRLERVSE